MKEKNLFRKLNFLIALAEFFVVAFFCGCGNLLSSDFADAVNGAKAKDGYGIVSGVLPSANLASARTAMPDNTTPDKYEVFAENGSNRIDATTDDANKTFSIALPYGTWSVTANGLKSGKVIFTKTELVVISADNPKQEIKFELQYSTDPADGAGKILLGVSFHNSIKSVDYILSKGATKIIVKVGKEEVDNGNFEIKHTVTNLGAYNLTINFYGDHSMLVYRIDQIVNVYANLTTNKFIGSEPYIKDGKIDLTDVSELEKFQQSTLYVDAEKGSDANTGTQFDPLRTFYRALELVNESTLDASTQFRIFLKTDVLDDTEIILDKNLTIASVDNNKPCTIKSRGGHKFTVGANAELMVQDVNFQKLRFLLNGKFEMNNSSISNVENGSSYGGGVHVTATGTFNMNGGEIKNCSSTSYGGGVYVAAGGTFKMDGGKIIGNTASESGGGVYVIGEERRFEMGGDAIISKNSAKNGGGVYIASIGNTASTVDTFLMEDGKIIGNTASENGGGVYVSGEAHSFKMEKGSIEKNAANLDGGGIYATGSYPTVCGGKINDNSASNGGGIFITGCKFDIMGGEISTNTATTGKGGGIYITGSVLEMRGGTVKKNDAQGEGDGIFIEQSGLPLSGSVKVEDGNDIYLYLITCQIAGELNQSKVATITPSNYAEGTNVLEADGTNILTITDSICEKFAVMPESNGTEWQIIPDSTGKKGILHKMPVGIYVRGSGAGWYEDNGKGDIKGSDNNPGSLESPFATIQKAIEKVLEMNDGTGDYRIYVDGEVAPNASDSAGKDGMASFANLDKNLNLTIRALSETKKATLNASGLMRAINAGRDSVKLNLTLEKLIIKNGNHTGGYGGGIHFNSPNGALKMSGIEIFENQAKYGGGISIRGGAFTATNCVIKKNQALSQGGGIFVGDSVDFEMTGGTTTSGNEAVLGGGIYVANTSSFTLTGGTIGGNTATDSGGGICFGNGTGVTGKVTIRGGSISGNTSSRGGAIYSAGTLEMVGPASIEKNTATGSNGGGGIYIAYGCIFTMTDGTIGGATTDTANNASNNGGGVYIQSGGKMTMSGGKIINNKAKYGAGIYAYRTTPSTGDITLTMNGGAISYNVSTDNGGGVYAQICTIMINSGEIRRNECQSDGGGVYLSDGTIIMAGGTISDNEGNDGGGVCISRSTSTTAGGKLTMKGGAISGNTGTNSGSGIAIKNYGIFEMEGGLVSGNHSNNKGKGAYIDYNATLVMKDTAQFAEGDDLYLYTNTGLPIPTIQIAGTLAESKVATITPSSYTVDRQVLSAGTGVTISQDICDKFAVTPEGSTKWKIMRNSTNNTGVLKKGDLSGGISTTIPGMGTYKFIAINANGGETPLTEGMTLAGGSSITLKEIQDTGGGYANRGIHLRFGNSRHFRKTIS